MKEIIIQWLEWRGLAVRGEQNGRPYTDFHPSCMPMFYVTRGHWCGSQLIDGICGNCSG